MIKERRKTISDNLITSEVYDKLLGYTCAQLEDVDITQRNIINILLPMKISNATIARLINDLIPEAKATAGSVASQIRFINKSSSDLDELVSMLDKELNNNG